jgi:epoxyqueuosine reductase
MSLADRLKAQAQQLGFGLVGIAPAITPPGYARFTDWLAAGFAGEMNYLSKHAAAREHPDALLPEVRSVVMVGMNYAPEPIASSTPPSPPGKFTGRIARYAQGKDYHDVLWERLNRLLTWVQHEVPGCRGRAVVDTAPLLERDYGRLAGLGWFGKNTMLLNKQIGSYFFLGALLLDAALPSDPPMETTHCGTCTACLEACPTAAFTAPGQLDARKCISYLTIELKGPIPVELRPGIGDWIFGCDICQEVCPWNRKAPPGADPELLPRPGQTDPDLLELLALTPPEFRARFRDTPLSRPKRRGLLRNVAIALGNRRDPVALPALLIALQDEEPLLRGAAAWALGQLPGAAQYPALQQRLTLETDATVRAEIQSVLERRTCQTNPLPPP